MDRIITYNLTEDFIQNLAGFVEDNFLRQGRDISRLAFVFGGRRPALFLKKELSRRLKNGFFPPAFFSIDEFMQYSLSKKTPYSEISDLDGCYIIYNLAKNIAPDILKEKEAFSEFLPWAREIIGFIDHLDLEGIEAKPLEDIQLNAHLGYDVPKNINALLESVIALRDAYHKALKEKNIYSKGLGYMVFSEEIREIDLTEFDYIFFCGFFYLHKTELDIIKKLYDSQKAILFFQGSDEDWTVFKDISAVFSHPLRPKKAQRPLFNLSIQAGFDVHSQACLAREALKKTKDYDKTVVVLPEPDNLVPLLSEIYSSVSDFNVSMGYPLNRSSVYSLFEAVFRAQETRHQDEYYTKDYLKALSHPLVKSLRFFTNPSLVRVLIHKIEEALLGLKKTPLGGKLFVRLSDIQNSSQLYEIALADMQKMDASVSWDAVKDAVCQLHALLFTSWETVSDFYGFALSLQRFLDVLIKKSPISKYPLNLKMAEKIFSIKEELLGSAFNREAFPKDDIFRIFRNRLDNVKIRFEGTPLKGLQILGLLETRSLNFQNVIIMDVNESVLPNLKIYQPLIPREVMIGLGLNRLEKEEEIQRYQFKRLIASAKNVHLIYKDTDKTEKSRFVEELLWDRQKKEKSLDVLALPKASFKIKVMPKKLEIEKTGDAIEFLRKLEYSASSINTYLYCPLGFYYRYVLGLEEKEDLLEEPQAADIGTFVHELLEETFSGFINKRPNIDAKFRRYFKAALDKKFSDEFQKKMKSDAFLIKEILDFRMERFLDNEAQRDVDEIIALERNFKADIKFRGENFKFQAFIDRIDRLSDKSLLILDYKTGDTGNLPLTNLKKIEAAGFAREALKHTIKSFQLPLYFYFVANDKRYKDSQANAALYSLKDSSDNQGLVKLFKEEVASADKKNLMDVYLKALEFIVCDDIVNPKIPFKADQASPRNCQNCPFFYMCR
jgi:hypothetical protein